MPCSLDSWNKASACAAAPRIQVRPWRRWEEDAIARVYRQNLPGSYGLLERNRSYWHWLLERRAYDQFYVALDGPDLWDLKESSTRLVGYAAIKGEKIVEFVTAPERRKAAMELLARVCGDAIEQDHRRIVAARCRRQPAAGVFSRRRRNRCCTLRGRDSAEFCMARLLDPLGLPAVDVRRVRRSGPPRPGSHGRWNLACSSKDESIRSRLPAAAGPWPTRWAAVISA